MLVGKGNYYMSKNSVSKIIIAKIGYECFTTGSLAF